MLKLLRCSFGFNNVRVILKEAKNSGRSDVFILMLQLMLIAIYLFMLLIWFIVLQKMVLIPLASVWIFLFTIGVFKELGLFDLKKSIIKAFRLRTKKEIIKEMYSCVIAIGVGKFILKYISSNQTKNS